MVNKVILVGRLGNDPEMKTTEGGKEMCSFSVATSETWKKDGEKPSKTEWHRITVWGKLAEICGLYLGKGSLVYIEGKLTTRKYEKDGVTQYSTGITADTMRMLGSKKDEENDPSPKAPAPPKEGAEDVPF